MNFNNILFNNISYQTKRTYFQCVGRSHYHIDFISKLQIYSNAVSLMASEIHEFEIIRFL